MTCVKKEIRSFVRLYQSTVPMYLDLSKAFDRVNHEILLLPIPNHLLKSYSTDCEHVVIALNLQGNQITFNVEFIKRNVFHQI